MADAWEEFQALKSKRDSLKKKSERRKKELEDLLLGATEIASSVTSSSTSNLSSTVDESKSEDLLNVKADAEIEYHGLCALAAVSLNLPADSRQICAAAIKRSGSHIAHHQFANVLHKFAAQNLISVEEGSKDGKWMLIVNTADHAKLVAMVTSIEATKSFGSSADVKSLKRPLESESGAAESVDKEDKKREAQKKKEKKDDDVLSLLSMASTRERESKKMGEEILELLSKPTAKEKSLAERFRSQGGAQVQEFCAHGTKEECIAVSGTVEPCKKLHFKKIIQQHTDESLGDCSFLNTCFHMDTCKYVHYEVDKSTLPRSESSLIRSDVVKQGTKEATTLFPPQWVQCDLRYLDMSVLGKFAVVMADPPWDIHMELPYGTMSDDEMRQLNVPTLQDEGLIFLWVTGRAMELGRECLELWGYERVDEIIWVKTNQLQRIIRTGRTGHWLNHGKEHCLVGMKGNPKNINRGLDCDVIVAEVRATSHKPDEIYGIIERLSPGTRKIELFGRPHNVQPNWVTLGNQLDGVHLIDPEIVRAFRAKYPDGIVPSS